MKRYCVIMCGGAGTRLWPFSRESRPKQFIDFFGIGQSLLQLTVERIRRIVPMENILFVTNSAYAGMLKEQIAGVEDSQILPEPARRNTAPSILWAARHIAAVDPDAAFVTLPADHVILKEIAFHHALRQAFDYVEKCGNLLALGITPTAAHTGYGYIQKGQPLREDPEVMKVKTFAEKPGQRMADIFMRSGEFVWNAGIFLGKVRSVIDAFERNAPEMSALFDSISDAYGTSSEMAGITKIFPKADTMTIEEAVLENADNMYVAEADLGWSDLGNWKSLHETAPKNREGNVTQGCRTLLADCEGCLVTAETDKVVAVAGLKDYVVADTADALLICPLEYGQRIRNAVNEVRARWGSDFI